VGRETTRGTLAAATRVLRGQGSIQEERVTFRSEAPHGVRVRGGSTGVIVKRGTSWKYDSDLSLEELLWFLTTGVASVTPTGSGPYTWAFAPALGSALESQIGTMTIEYVETDGSVNQYVAGCAYAVTQELSIEAQPGEVTRLSASGIAQARQSVTPSSTATPYSPRTTVPGSLWEVYWDGTWAGRGTTKLGSVTNMSFDLKTGWDADWTLEGRSSLDWARLRPGVIEATCKLTVELDAIGAARIADWRADTPAAVRLKAAPSANASIQIDLWGRLQDDLSLGEDGEVTTVDLTLEAFYDPSQAGVLAIQVVTGVSTL
jgi:hypothetical protein